MHGHNWVVRAYYEFERVDDRGLTIDYLELKAGMDRVILERFDHRHLNDIPPFDRVNPTAEAVAAWFYREMRPRIAEVSGGRAALNAVRLWETPDSCVTYTEEA